MYPTDAEPRGDGEGRPSREKGKCRERRAREGNDICMEVQGLYIKTWIATNTGPFQTTEQQGSKLSETEKSSNKEAKTTGSSKVRIMR